MTSISTVNSSSSIQSFSQVNQRGMPPPPPEGEQGGKDGGGLLGAIDAALKSAGVEGGLESIFGQSSGSSTSTDATVTDSDSSDSSTTTDAASALNSFLQELMSALQAQGSTDASSTETSSADSSDVAMQGMPPPPPHGYGGQGMENKLQSLLSSLTSSSSDSSTDSNTDTDSSLESSFQSLVSALGGNSDNSNLTGFLQALSTSMQHRGPSGNVVSTTA